MWIWPRKRLDGMGYQPVSFVGINWEEKKKLVANMVHIDCIWGMFFH